MANRIDYSQVVQSYFDNEMSAEERADFEQLIERDPALQEEFNLQQDIIEGIRTYRTQELKAHLAAVSVGGIVWTAGLRWGVLGTSVAAISVVGYFFLIPELPESYSEVDLGSGVVLELSDTQLVPAKPLAVENPEEFFLTFEDRDQSDVTRTTEDYSEPATVVSTVIPSTSEEQDIEVQASAPVFTMPTPQLNVPQFSSDDPNSSSVQNPDDVPGATFVERNRNSKKIDMEVVEDRRHNFHYQFFNSKLYLYGDFEGKIYEIIEFNNHEGREFYFYFDQKFYPVIKGQREITKLSAIVDQELETSLERYRQNNLR
ncbi:MAG TPA: hypothetical protein DCE41_14710 [Cytophagales bacterium]|nr:hypothetical protein [Cytophagales bacterium]HAA17857.1 hypothetical protein [Cytophagales bacterium]HAP58221.1 hypothetical protein [Cytophagales bacterium]